MAPKTVAPDVADVPVIFLPQVSEDGHVKRILVRAIASAAVAAFAAGAVPTLVAAQGATTMGAVRGTVTGPAGKLLADVTVIATNQETGIRRIGVSRPGGEYRIGFIEPGIYTIKAQQIGYRPVQTPNVRIGLGQVEKLDFELTEAATQLSTVRVTAEIAPLIETSKTGSNTRIGAQQINDLPLNGRNFKDLVKLTPGMSDVGNAGSGGGQSIGGGRLGGSNIMMDGTNNNESFFGGDARGGDRAPFSYSVETVKEIQVVTNAVDVELGSFTGGVVNAVTKSGTNKLSGRVWMYGRADQMFGQTTTGVDFLGRTPTNFERQQYGAQISGPIIKDKMHFLVNFERQTGYDPLLAFVGDNTDAGIRASGINPDTLKNFLAIAQRVYGINLGSVTGSSASPVYTGEVGRFVANTDESAVFVRLDWQITDKHHLTLRDNNSETNLTQDRLFVSPTSQDLLSNSGQNQDKSNSAVLALTSVFRNVSNEFRAQYATVRKPRLSNPTAGLIPLPQVSVNNINSVLSDGTTFRTSTSFGADPILHANLLETDLVEFIDNIRITVGNHNVKLGGNYTATSVFNKFRQNGLGSFTFNSMSDFENGIVTSFTRSVPYPGNADIIDAQFKLNEYALWLQDEWQINKNVFVQFGVRMDGQQVPDKPTYNTTLTRLFPYLDTRNMPVSAATFSPRFGITYDPDATGRQLFRLSSALIYGRNPYVTISNAFVNNGLAQSQISCTGAAAPVPDFVSYAANPSTIPTACVGSGAPPPAATINVFEKDYKLPYTWKTNIGYDREIVPGWRVSIEGIFGVVRNTFLVQDDNQNTVPYFAIEGGIPVYADPTSISATGAQNNSFSRRTTQFARVLVHRGLGGSIIQQGYLELKGSGRWGSLYAQYTYDRTTDNGSLGCCITNSMYGAGRTSGNMNNYDDQWAAPDFERPHTLVISPTFFLPLGIRMSSVFTARSGIPWTPVYGSDVSALAGAFTTRAYVPTEGEIYFGGSTPGFNQPFPMGTNSSGADAQNQREILDASIKNNPCVLAQRGKIAQRNSCRNPDIVTMDLRLSKEFKTWRGQTIELQFDWFNFGNALNSNWGNFTTVSGANQNLLTVRGFDQVNKRYIYQANQNLGVPTPVSIGVTLQQQMQLGIRYTF